MGIVNVLLKRVILPLCLLLSIFGCGVLLPTPSHREMLEVDGALSSPELTERLLTIFAEHGISQCRGTPRLDDSLPVWSYS